LYRFVGGALSQRIKKKAVHFLGVGGSGMSNLALLARWNGWAVSGSDMQESAKLQALRDEGVNVFVGHSPENVQQSQGIIGLPDAVIVSSAVPEDNIELKTALLCGVPVYRRDEWLGQITEGSAVIAVAGTHGKTSTTAMTAYVLQSVWGDLKAMVGGDVMQLPRQSGALWGDGPFFLVEADEYARAFHQLAPDWAVVTNVELDHVDVYASQAEFEQAFYHFICNVREGGVLLMNGDDAGGRAVLQRLRGEDTPFPLGGRRIMTYGLQRGSEWRAADLAPNDRGGVDYKVLRRGQEVCEVSLQLPGEHNVVNSLAALVSASMLTVQRRRGREVADTAIELPFPNTVTDADRNWDEVAGALHECARVLEGFEGLRRRFEVIGEGNGFTVVDDYAHHPTEISAALQAARQRFPGKPVWVVFEPHTYSRLESFFDALVVALGEADRVIVTDVYGARESLVGLQSMGGLEGLLAEQVRRAVPCEYISSHSDIIQRLTFELSAEPKEVAILTLGAGRVTSLGPQLLRQL